MLSIFTAFMMIVIAGKFVATTSILNDELESTIKGGGRRLNLIILKIYFKNCVCVLCKNKVDTFIL